MNSKAPAKPAGRWPLCSRRCSARDGSWPEYRERSSATVVTSAADGRGRSSRWYRASVPASEGVGRGREARHPQVRSQQVQAGAVGGLGDCAGRPRRPSWTASSSCSPPTTHSSLARLPEQRDDRPVLRCLAGGRLRLETGQPQLAGDVGRRRRESGPRCPARPAIPPGMVTSTGCPRPALARRVNQTRTVDRLGGTGPRHQQVPGGVRQEPS